MTTIPVIDFTSLSLDIDDNKLDLNAVKATSQLMIDAFTDVGFVYLRHTGFPDKLLKEVDLEAERFFSLPNATKARYPYGNENHGWVAPGQESLDPKRPGDLKECFDINLTSLKDDLRWPTQELPNFKPTILRCFETSSKLALRVLLGIAYGLHLEDVNYFTKCHRGIAKPGGQASMRILRYQPLQSSDIKADSVRLGEHTDYGSVTLLFQRDVGGLQVRRCDGKWIDAEPIKDTVLVNIGNLMQRWTSDRLISTPHRVQIPGDEFQRQTVRRSVAFFVHPDTDVTITCLDGSDKYPPVNSAENLAERLNASYINVNVYG